MKGSLALGAGLSSPQGRAVARTRALALTLTVCALGGTAAAQEATEPVDEPADHSEVPAPDIDPQEALGGLSADDLAALNRPDPSDLDRIDDAPLGTCDGLERSRLEQMRSEAPDRVPCFVGCEVQATCGALACLPVGSEARNGEVGYCGQCTSDRSCGGRSCSEGRCALWADPIAPDAVYPQFFLLTLDATVNALDGESTRVLPGVGFVYQGAFRKVKPVALDSGGWLTTDLPSWYFNLGGSVAMGLSGTQQILLDAGLTRYMPWPKVFMTSLSVGPVYQRRGDAVWNLQGTNSNVDRLGGGVTLGFLYNIFVRAAYLQRVRGEAEEDQALLFSLLYMHDLVDELVPDRFKKFIPKEFR